MPTRIYPGPTASPSAVPSLEELLAEVRLKTGTAPGVPTLLRPPPEDATDMGAINGLSSMLKPYQGQGPMGMNTSSSTFASLLGGGSDILGGFGGTSTVGGYSGGSSGGYPSPTGYTGGSSGSVADYTTTGPLNNGDPGSMPQYGFDPDTLRSVQGITGVAPAVNQLMRAENVLGLPGISDAVSGEGFRTRDEQVAAYNSYLAGTGNLAAPPGQSMHEAGRAFDISTEYLLQHPELREWLDEKGWVNAVTGEPWHWEYQGPATVNRQGPQQGQGGAPQRVQIPEGVPENIAQYAIRQARAEGIPPALVLAKIEHESNFDPNAVSSAGAQGIMQLMPGTAAELGVENPFDWRENIQGGTDYLADLHDSGLNWRDTIAAYGWGPGAYNDPDAQSAASDVFAMARDYRAPRRTSAGSGGPPASSAGSGSGGSASPRRRASSTLDPRQQRLIREGMIG